MMRKSYIIVLVLLLLSIVMGVSASDTPEHPVDPNQRKIWETERRLNLESKSVPNDYQNNLSLTQITAPAMNKAPKWAINPASGHGSIISLEVGLLMKDYSTKYSYVYSKEYYSDIPSTAETCVILTSGEYMISVEALYSDYTSGTVQLTFTVSGTNVLSAKVTEIVNSCKKSSDWETALCLHDWIAHHMVYDGSTGFYGADGALLRGYGVCDSYSKAFFMLCQKAGIPVGRVTGGNHAWNIIKINGKWYHVDVTWDDGDDDRVPVGYTYFCVNEETISIDHTIEKYEGEYGPSTSLDMNYYVVTGEWKNWPVYSSYTYEVVPLIDDIVMTFEDYGETTYTIDENSSLSCYQTDDGGIFCFGSNDIRLNILSYALPLAAADIKESDGTPMNVEISQSPLTITLLTPINVIRLPENITTIESQSFSGIGAKKVVLPRSCWKIESLAFAGSKVKTVVFPKYISIYNSTDIADDAFANCSGLIFVTTNEAVIEYAQSHGITVRE